MPNLNDFLDLIQQLESSGGQNLDHARVPAGIHAGDKAIGSRALMPNTIKTLANRNMRDNVADSLDKEIALSSINLEQKMQENPKKLDQYERQLAETILNKMSGNVDLAATSWLHGMNITPEAAAEKLEMNPEYQQRIDNVVNERHYQSKPDWMKTSEKQGRLDKKMSKYYDNKNKEAKPYEAFKSLQSYLGKK